MDERIKEVEEKLKEPDFLKRQINGLLLNKYQIEVLERVAYELQELSYYNEVRK